MKVEFNGVAIISLPIARRVHGGGVGYNPKKVQRVG
jgi:hypothetical protein